MATKEEGEIMLASPRDLDACLGVVLTIESFIIKCLIQGYIDRHETPPKCLTKYNKATSLKMNSLDSHTSKTGLRPDRSDLQRFRSTGSMRPPSRGLDTFLVKRPRGEGSTPSSSQSGHQQPPITLSSDSD